MTCIFLCVISTISAQENSWLKKGDSLLVSGDFFQAGICYERVLFEGTDVTSMYLAAQGKLDCLKRKARYSEAEKFIASVLFSSFSTEQIIWLSEQRILCAYLAGQFENCISLSNLLVIQFPEHRMSGFLQSLKVLSFNELKQWKEAESAWLEWAKDKDSAVIKNNPYSRLPKFKSEDKAEALSTFIPGGGQIYAGKPFEGIVSILIQGAGIYYGVISFQDRYYLSAWAGAGLFGSFHMGGVRRSVVLVRKYNQKRMARFNAQVRERMLGTK